MAFDLLSEPIRKFIRKKRWPALRPIQAAAIIKIMSSSDNYVLASKTASGKTEAAFLPILSKTNFNERGVQVLYISPLIALINDQFLRVEELCKNLEISVTKWHGEAKRSLKRKLLENPNGIVLITPESIEAMFVNSPYNAKLLFSNLKFIVLDEIHSFLGSDRGVQLTSLISRIQLLNQTSITIVGLSATIGKANFQEVKKITNKPDSTKILLHNARNESLVHFNFYESTSSELPLELIKDLYIETSDHKVLVFPNSRGRTEEIAVKLRKLSKKVNGHDYYFSHHSSVDKEIRENVEQFAKNNERYNFCISCTSTLELGIDIGTVDIIVQIDSTFSVSSLVQRLGRSGRKDTSKSNIILYATDKWNLLQSLACWNLLKQDILEPVVFPNYPHDLLLHQILSFVKQVSGCSISVLLEFIKQNNIFSHISNEMLKQLIQEAIRSDLLEIVQGELIIGINGESIVNSREFYSVFKSEPNLKVLSSGKKIGEIPFSPQIQVNENIFLSARIWKIADVDFASSKIQVIKAVDGKKPIFFGSAGLIHPIIRKEMLRILKDEKKNIDLNDICSDIINDLRSDFINFNIQDINYDRPIIVKSNKIEFYTFNGTQVNRSISLILKYKKINFSFYDYNSLFEICLNYSDFQKMLKSVDDLAIHIDSWLYQELDSNKNLISFSKWGHLLSKKFQIDIIKERYFDFEAAFEFLKKVELRTGEKK